MSGWFLYLKVQEDLLESMRGEHMLDVVFCCSITAAAVVGSSVVPAVTARWHCHGCASLIQFVSVIPVCR